MAALFTGMVLALQFHDTLDHFGSVELLGSATGLALTRISTAKGYYLHLDRRGAYGAEGVSRTTTEAVVLASIGALFGDYLIGAIML